MKLAKGDTVLTVRTIDGIYAKQISIENHVIQSSGKKITRLERYYSDLDTDSLTRSIERIEASNIIGIVITNEDELLRVINKILSKQEDILKRIIEDIENNGQNGRTKRQLKSFSRAYEIVDMRGKEK